MLGYGFADKGVKLAGKVLRLFKAVGKLAEGLSHNGVDKGCRRGGGHGRAEHTELKLVTGKGEW